MDERVVLAEALEGVVMRHHVAGHIEAGWLQSLSDDLVSAALLATPQPEAGLREAVEDAIATLDHVESDLRHRRAALAAALREPKP